MSTEVERFTTVQQIQDDTAFTEATLDDNLMSQAGLLAHYGVLVAKAQRQVDKSKQVLEITEAQSARKIREDLESEGKKTTEKMIEQEVLIDLKVNSAKTRYADAKEVYETLRIALEALRHKRDAMVQIGVHRRTEMELNGRIRGRVDGAEDRAAMLREELADRASKVIAAA